MPPTNSRHASSLPPSLQWPQARDVHLKQRNQPGSCFWLGLCSECTLWRVIQVIQVTNYIQWQSIRGTFLRRYFLFKLAFFSNYSSLKIIPSAGANSVTLSNYKQPFSTGHNMILCGAIRTRGRRRVRHLWLQNFMIMIGASFPPSLLCWPSFEVSGFSSSSSHLFLSASEMGWQVGFLWVFVFVGKHDQPWNEAR